MNDNKYSQPIKFPCDFVIKIMGASNHELEAIVIAILQRHCTAENIKNITKRHSKKGNYLALTITLYAENKAQLDAIYLELSKTPEILVSL